MKHTLRTLAALFLLSLFFTASPGDRRAAAQEINPDLYSSLQWRHIGPPGNRASAVVGVPGDPMISSGL